MPSGFKGFLLGTVQGWAATMALFLAYLAIPLLGMLPGIFAPFPALYFRLKEGRRTGIAIVALSLATLAAAGGPANAALYLFQCGAVSLALPEFLSRGKGGARSIACTTAISAALVALTAALFSLTQGVDVNALVVKGIQSSIAHTAQIYEKSGLKGEELKAFQAALADAGSLIERIYPALLVVAVGFIAGVNLLLLRKVSRRLPRPLTLGEFARFKTPDWTIWIMIVAGFTMLAPQALAVRVALNTLIVILPLYFIQGMAVIATLFERHAVPRFMRGLFYLLLVVTQFLAIAVIVLGIFDLWGDFRTPKKKENL